MKDLLLTFHDGPKSLTTKCDNHLFERRSLFPRLEQIYALVATLPLFGTTQVLILILLGGPTPTEINTGPTPMEINTTCH